METECVPHILPKLLKNINGNVGHISHTVPNRAQLPPVTLMKTKESRVILVFQIHQAPGQVT
ncbi:hypothetical protein KSF78_0005838 [Schistosoma japonicum]|nr:hypothetical protein KSF78_0005838 [Schistosoma japonicum]